ncbi:MAG: hypothetical protein FJW23_12535 [Acidimicrobiia bacterium]|nr:hypothetical protein [Acidimicrobiia bacterium]
MTLVPRPVVSSLTGLLLGVAACAPPSEAPAPEGESAGGQQVPIFEVDPLWPKPLPNNWVTGGIVGVGVDADDRVWVMHRPSFIVANERAAADGRTSLCCYPAPPVLVFDEEGNVVKSWGPQRTFASPGSAIVDDAVADPEWPEWAQSEHGMHIDHKGFVWTGGNGQKDSRLLKFTQEGEFVMAVGGFAPYGTSGPGHDGGPDSQDLENLNKPAKAVVDPSTNEVYVADGYGNRRVIVFDADTGEYRRHWGAYGNEPDDADPYNATRGGVDGTYDPDVVSQQFGRPAHGIIVSRDGRVYVADRTNNRVQAFTTGGTFVAEGFIDRHARGFGSAFDVELSADPAQQFVYVADGMNQRIVVLRRDTLEVVSRFGHGGPYPGGFYAVHALAVDSQGNLYTGETLHGRRVQRWVFKGTRPQTPQDLE